MKNYTYNYNVQSVTFQKISVVFLNSATSVMPLLQDNFK